MCNALEEHNGRVSIGGRNITNLRFADDIDALAEEEQELEGLVESLDKICTFFWLVDFGFNGPLRQYFSLYRVVSQREGERGKKG